MLIVPDVQDVYTPLQTDLILPVSEVCSIFYFISLEILRETFCAWKHFYLFFVALVPRESGAVAG